MGTPALERFMGPPALWADEYPHPFIRASSLTLLRLQADVTAVMDLPMSPDAGFPATAKVSSVLALSTRITSSTTLQTNGGYEHRNRQGQI
jgi:hypothetical protein